MLLRAGPEELVFVEGSGVDEALNPYEEAKLLKFLQQRATDLKSAPREIEISTHALYD